MPLSKNVALSCVFVIIAGAAGAATFDVNLTVDEPDFDPGDGVCRASVTMGCSLRAAIEEANALVGYDVINLPAGTFTLTISGTEEDDAATGDLDVRGDLTIYGAGMDSTRIDAAGIDRVFDLHTGVLQLVGLTVSGGRATTSTSSVGGGISAYGSILSIGGCRLTDNIANQGGAIYTSSGTTLQIADSLLDANQTQDLGFENQYGPAISALGGLSLESSTVTGNVAEWGQSFAVHVRCYVGSVVLLNSTIAENSSSAVYTYNCDTTLHHATVIDNSAYGITLGSYDNTDTRVVRNSIIAGNGLDCNLSTGTTINFDHTLDGDDSCGLLVVDSNLPMTDPMLLPLRNWGGPTPTVYPRPLVSPVVDAGNGAICYLTDQRGEVRGGDGNGDGSSGCDIGAVEATDLVFFDDLEDGSVGAWSTAVGLEP